MTFDLYAAFVPTTRQLLAALPGAINKAEQYVADGECTDGDLLGARLSEDMWALPLHISACVMHSAYTLDQLKGGAFKPDLAIIPEDWATMRTIIAQAEDRLAAATPEEVADIATREIAFVVEEQTHFTLPGERFLLGFSQPNFHFHATTFYDLLRMKGVPLSKYDFLGDPAGPKPKS